MSLSSDLISQFIKATNDDKKEKKEAIVYGKTVEHEGTIYVKIDGSDRLTPISTTVNVKSDERVQVLIKDHTATVTGNISTPAARTDDVEKIGGQVTEFDYVMAYKVTTEDLSAVNATIDSLIAKTSQITELAAVNAEIQSLKAKYAEMDTVSAKDAEILNAEIENLQAEIADIGILSTEQLDAVNADIDNLKAYNADFTYVSADRLTAIKADINELDVKKLTAEQAELKFANIDFANITEAAVEKLFSDSGIIKDLVVDEGHITGELVGVTIKGDLIEAGTVKADKLVVKGSDGLFYKLNLDAMGETTTEVVPTDGLHGDVIVANTITAEKINVSDLVAFGATIGGFKIDDHALYSGVKSSATNTTRGVFLGDEGEFAVGDSTNFFRYYKDIDGTYKLEIRASQLILGTSSKTIEEELKEIRDEVTTNLRIESSRGTVFKNDNVSTVLSAVIYRGSQRITNMTNLRATMGSSAYLQWKWQRLDETSYGVISASDTRLGNDGFTFTLSPEDVDTKVTFMCELHT